MATVGIEEGAPPEDLAVLLFALPHRNLPSPPHCRLFFHPCRNTCIVDHCQPRRTKSAKSSRHAVLCSVGKRGKSCSALRGRWSAVNDRGWVNSSGDGGGSSGNLTASVSTIGHTLRRAHCALDLNAASLEIDCPINITSIPPLRSILWITRTRTSDH